MRKTISLFLIFIALWSTDQRAFALEDEPNRDTPAVFSESEEETTNTLPDAVSGPFQSLCAIGAFAFGKSALTTLVEFPAENITVRMQGENQTYLLQAMKKVWNQEGLHGFYKGWIPGYSRTFAKIGYQWSLIHLLQGSSISRELDELEPRKNLKNAFIALITSCVDVAILSPLEKAKVQSILDTTPSGRVPRVFPPDGRQVLNAFRSWVKSSPYRGASPFFAEQFFGWSLFLIGQNEGQLQARKILGDHPTEASKGLLRLGLSIGLGGIEAALVLPFINVRTKMIQEESTWSLQKFYQSIRQNKVNSLYLGWKPALLRASLANLCDIYFISYLETLSIKETPPEELR